MIEARGMLVMPGAVDTHTHLNAEMLNPPRPNRPQDDYVTGSAAAFAGGMITISNFIPCSRMKTLPPTPVVSKNTNELKTRGAGCRRFG